MPAIPVMSLSALLLAASAMAQPPAPPQTAPTQSPAVLTTTSEIQPATAAPVAAPGSITTADELLTALETADQSIRTLQSDLVHLKRESELIGNRTQEQHGRLALRVDPAPPGSPTPRRLIQIDFTDLYIDNVKRTEQKTFIFDGQWLIERQPDEKQIFKRQLTPPGKSIDPLALGEGQFPIPIGQKRERIVERFDVALLPGEQDFPSRPGAASPQTPPAWAADSYQLRLVPKKGTHEFRDYREIRVWYRKGDLLPRMARAVNKDDSADEVVLSNVRLNQDLPGGVFDTKAPEGWNVEVSEYRSQTDDK